MEVSEALKRFRRTFDLKQDNVAQALGVNRQVYQPYETGRTLPSVKTILKIAKAFDVSTDYLLGLSDIPRLAPNDAHDAEIFARIEASANDLLRLIEGEVKRRGCVQDNQSAQQQAVCRSNTTID
ncbi:MAG: helix-turn-helix transcriptional regulator [Selenomonadaceae bacterium]|nr:helix-turn-helix transcriptional regulator [Selenomonadaceae bacterium]MBR1805808.1 helix-turn-helix transcriptional regulator [Selenomonadaceae bacterium]